MISKLASQYNFQNNIQILKAWKPTKGHFFNCYWAAPWLTLGHTQGDSLTNLMLIPEF